jgi:methyl-accepting chemotaxis protein
MNLRPSRRILPFGAKDGELRSAQSLRQRLVFIAGAAALFVLGAVTYTGLLLLRKSMASDEDARVVSTASLSKQLVDRVLEERSRQVALIATSPSVITAARRGLAKSEELGLRKYSNEQLDKTLFARTLSQQVDEDAIKYLTSLSAKLDIIDVIVTDTLGFNAIVTTTPSDFVQSDEAWWQIAWMADSSSAVATQDGKKRTVVELARVIRDRNTKVGVVKVKFGLSMVDAALTQASVSGSALRVDLVDSVGQIIASSSPVTRFKALPGYSQLVGFEQNVPFDFASDSTVRRAAVGIANAGRWRLVAHMSERDATRGYAVARNALLAGVAFMLVLIAVSLSVAGRFIHRRITGPAQELAEVAEAVAAGDLSKRVSGATADDEVGRLARAVAAMTDELRRLVGALNESAQETASMTAEINASSEEMAASAGQIAHTASDLSQQSNLMAETIQALAGSSEQLVGVAADLDAGAREGVERNAHLRTLALDNRSRLDESSAALSSLSTDVEASAAAIDQLAQASEEVRTFVTLVQKLARQSKLLALNAAMEAARAGDHGHGFAVVAEEVRRLAAMSSEAAERTERVVTGVLSAVTQSRVSSERTVDTVRTVLNATEEGSRSFVQIEAAVAEADGWTASIRNAAVSTTNLSRDLRSKLDSLASGTEAFAAAMQEVAASSEQQSASTEEIAAAAATLAGAAERLGKLVSNLRIDETPAERPEPPQAGISMRLPPELGVLRPLTS